MMHRHSRREPASQGRLFRWRDAHAQPSEGRQDSALYERPSREEVLEIVRQQRLHFLLLERAMAELSSEVADEAELHGPSAPARSPQPGNARASLQHDLEAILLAELCDESDLDSSTEVGPTEPADGTDRSRR
jgi:hypothetical protein